MRKANGFINTNKKNQQQQQRSISHSKMRKRNCRHNKNIFNLLKLCSALHFVLESNTGTHTYVQHHKPTPTHTHRHRDTHMHKVTRS